MNQLLDTHQIKYHLIFKIEIKTNQLKNEYYIVLRLLNTSTCQIAVLYYCKITILIAHHCVVMNR